jgi:DNA-binding MarR family transcriptional regulator
MSVEPSPYDLLIEFLRLQAAMERRSEAFFQQYGLTSAQFNILNLLANRGGQMEQMELVEELLVGKSSISIVLSRVVREGLVTRMEHPRDRRQVILNLTPEGQALWDKVAPEYQARVEQIFGGQAPADRKRLVEEVRKILVALENPELAGETAAVKKKKAGAS